jgi:phospholipid-translocating ATPase
MLAKATILYFFISYTYLTTASRRDGYSPPLYEWSTVIAVSGVMVIDIFTGLCATAWTWWHAFAVFFGIVVVWLFTVCFLH